MVVFEAVGDRVVTVGSAAFVVLDVALASLNIWIGGANAVLGVVCLAPAVWVSWLLYRWFTEA